MAWGMTEIMTKARLRGIAQNNPWYWFLLTTTELDKTHDKLNGWHWFWGLNYLHQERDKFPKLNITEIQKSVSNKHWLKKINISSLPPVQDDLRNLVTEFSSYLKTDDYSKINFSSLIFEENKDFSNFIFPIEVSFKKTEFHDEVNFKNTLFIEDAFFNGAEFFNDASFINAKFIKDIFFNDAKFFETADFEDAEFQTKDSYCKETAKFRNTIFKKIANFRNATFWGYANFKGAKLEGRAFFQKAKFKWHAPRFYDATFNNEMTWSGITLPKFAEAEVDRHTKVGEEFEPVKCDECTECAKCVERDKCIKHAKCVRCKKLIEENRTRRIEENQNSYENTAILLAGRKKFHDEHLFFRHEMGCRRELEKNLFICLMFLLYEILADYGYGIGRAFKAWLWHMALGMLAIIMTATYAGGIIASEILFCSFSTSIANANPFVFVIIKDGSLMDCYIELNKRSPMIFGLIRGFQTFIGVTLLFLFLTTLRVRFRLKITNN